MIVRENLEQARYDKKRRCRAIEREFGLHNQCSYDYAMFVLQCPFPAGELIFTQRNSSVYLDAYQTRILDWDL